METTDWQMWPQEASTLHPNSSTNLSSHDMRKCRIYYYCIRAIFGGFLLVMGVVGNLLTILVMRSVPRQTATIRALMFLAIADLLVIAQYGLMAVSVPLLSLIKVKYRMVQLYLLLYGMPLGQMTNFISVCITVIVTWQRYVSVCLPHKASTYGSAITVKTQVILITAASIMFHAPLFFQDEIVKENDASDLIRREFAQQHSYSIFYSVVLIHLVRYFIPMSFLVYMAHGLVKQLNKTRVIKTRGITACQRAKMELTLSVIIVIAIFVVCQSFVPIRQILMLIYVPYSAAIQCGGPLFFFGPLDLICILVNSSSNFLIFVVCARGFRRRLRLLCVRIKDQTTGTDIDPEQIQQAQKLVNLSPSV